MTDDSVKAMDQELQRRIVVAYEAFMADLMVAHRPDFLEIGVSMPQAKVLYLLLAAGEVHMSQLVTLLGVSLSTVSGLVERLVDQGLATRRDDPLDRRQVLVTATPAAATLLERFREFNRHQLLILLDRLSSDELVTVANAIELLARAASHEAAPPSISPLTPADHPTGGAFERNPA